MRRLALCGAVLAALCVAAPAVSAAAAPCKLTPRSACFGIESVATALSTKQAGAHPDFELDVAIVQDPESKPNVFGLHDSYAPTRRIHFEVPPGFVGDPNVFGDSGQCAVSQLVSFTTEACPNASQLGLSRVFGYGLEDDLLEPVYMMKPPGGDVVARLGLVAGGYPTFVDFRLRSDSDYGLTAEVDNASTAASLVKLETTLWGVPADPAHDEERCTPQEALFGCEVSVPRPPGIAPLPFLTNPTRCGSKETVTVRAASWAEPERIDDPANAATTPFPQIVGCNSLPFGPSLTVDPTSHRAASPTGANVTIKLPASAGAKVLEPAQMRAITVKLPEGLAFNPAAGDGLATCSAGQVRLGTQEASACPDAAKLADTDFDIPVLERNLKGAVYLREPEPGHPFRIWITADDLGLHIKLKGELEVDKTTGQITSVTSEIPQAPVREATLEFKSGFRAPLVTPDRCGTFQTEYEFVPWSGGPPVKGSTPMTIDEGCDTGAFNPKLSAGTTDPAAGSFSPFVFTLTKADGEQNPESLDISLPKGLAASFRGIPRCQGAAAANGTCSAASAIGHVDAAVGAGPSPLWVPQAGKRPTAVYLGGPYKGGPLSIIAVVPKQAGPFDFGDEVIRSAVYVDPLTAQATVRSDAFPRLIEGIPISLRTIHVAIDRPSFTLNPTNCRAKTISAAVTSSQGAIAHPSTPFAAADCAALPFKPNLSLKLKGGTKRGGHPALTAMLRPRPGDANLSETVVRLPHSAFLDQAHIRTICTRVQYSAGAGQGAACPAASIYGHVKAVTPLLDQPLEGPVYLRSSNHNLPDLVLSLHGLIDVEAVGRIDSVKGGIRSSFESIPDAPITTVTLEMQGQKKGLIVNSTDICRGTHRADVEFTGQNGKRAQVHPGTRGSCGKGRGRGKRRHR